MVFSAPLLAATVATHLAWTRHDVKTIPYRLGDASLFGRSSESCRVQYEAEDDIGIVPESLKWRFKPPHSRDWLQFDAPTLCEKLTSEGKGGKARVLFVGDSLSEMQLNSLAALMGSNTECGLEGARPGGNPGYFQPSDPQSEELGLSPEDVPVDTCPSKSDSATVCDGNVYLRQFGTTDLVSLHEEGGFEPPHPINITIHRKWIQTFDMVILSLGAWEGFDPKRAADVWKTVLAPHQTTFLRSFPVGHSHTRAHWDHTWNSTDFHPLLKSRKYRAPFVTAKEMTDYYSHTESHYTWLTIEKDRVEGIRSFADIGVVNVMDIFFFGSMMWDRHRDPLHYCLPGPPDYWNDVLFNLIVRGHLNDYSAWHDQLAQEVNAAGGLRLYAGWT